MFTFKQFSIRQDRCAQKVSEMACIFGAWIDVPEDYRSVLDIGSGTGLLSLMLAQRTAVQVDAVELEPACFLQGRENVLASPFHERIECIHADIRTYRPGKQYDAIIANPPFFEGQLKAGNRERSLARHADTLTLNELMDAIHYLLAPSGRFSVLFPFDRMNEVMNHAVEYGYVPVRMMRVQHSPLHEPRIWMAEFSRIPGPVHRETLIVKEDGQYSRAMTKLLKSYYLSL